MFLFDPQIGLSGAGGRLEIAAGDFLVPDPPAQAGFFIAGLSWINVIAQWSWIRIA